MGWRTASHEVEGLPPFLLSGRDEFFCSLGNGHFSQALNLFRTGCRNKWSHVPFRVGKDDALREALDEGVDSVVLKGDIPVENRRFIAEMLNRAHGRRWTIGEDGQVSISEDFQGMEQSPVCGYEQGSRCGGVELP